MDSILKYLDQIEDLLEESKPVPFSSRVAVDKEKVFDIIDEMRLNMPNEIRQAQKIIGEHDKVLNEAKAKAQNVIKEAEEKANKLVDEHEIYKQAVEEGAEIIEESKKSARDMRLNAMDYADEILARTEEIIRETLESLQQHNNATEGYFNKTIDVIYDNRMELRGVKSK